MVDPSVLSWTIYGFALYYWWMVFKAIRDVGPEGIFIYPSFMMMGALTTIFTVVNFVQSVWGHILAQIQ